MYGCITLTLWADSEVVIQEVNMSMLSTCQYILKWQQNKHSDHLQTELQSPFGSLSNYKV